MTLPGTFGQLAQLMQTTATTGIGAGMDADALRKFAGRTMLTASIVAPTIDNNLLSKEIVNLLAGKAGTHNILGLRLGLQGQAAKDFNALAPEQRLAELNKIYDKYKDATDAISHSWRAQFTTLKDNVLYNIMQPITQPLFEHVKADLVKVNDWFVKNKTEIQHFTQIVGNDLARAWDRVVDVVTKLEPLVANIGGYLSKLNFSDLAHGVEKMGLTYAGLKVAGAVIPSAIGALGSAGAAAAAGVEVSVVSFLGAGVLSAVALAFAGYTHNMTTDVDHDGNFNKATVDATKGMAFRSAEMVKSLGEIAHNTATAASALGSMAAQTGNFLLGGASFLTDAFSQLSQLGADWSRGISTLLPGWEDPHLHVRTDSAIPPPYVKPVDDRLEALLKREQIQQRSGAITKVEIVVKGSDDPTRVARKTLQAFQELQRKQNQLTSGRNPQPIR
jgi:hypothetical protein